MARRSIDIKIEEKGRDQGKLFKITEMSAFDTEAWAERAINAILRNATAQDLSVLLPLVYSYVQQVNEDKSLEEVVEDREEGKAAINQATESLAIYFASMFFQLPYDELRVVSDPLLQCCAIYLNPGQSQITEPVLNNPTQYIEEASTIFGLKREVFKLHTDFFTNGAKRHLSKFLSQMDSVTDQPSDTPPTFPKPSAKS
ncbi:unnamed protein product [Commensalibacter communis]|uniref:hypothetical protein n=1 Tax=Commensalibacter communis TaxID=2972786 RepID=UPI0022FF5EB3|nr:hypothetical protein [Commensalibacter communis]CAI3955148.1 unnamed protein product [Commensalibacter communis]CAI3955912.1 unnamed protein product [Commensalibacter communis]